MKILKIKFPWPKESEQSIKHNWSHCQSRMDVPSNNPSGSAQMVSGRLWGLHTSPGALLLHYGSLLGSVSAGKGRQSSMVNNTHKG